jgi:hypothetical protein
MPFRPGLSSICIWATGLKRVLKESTALIETVNITEQALDGFFLFFEALLEFVKI